MILLEQHNDRDLSNVRNLLNDMGRLEKEANKLGEEYAIDRSRYDQTSDGLLCLQDFCIDRDRRLKNRKQRVQNLIALVRHIPIDEKLTNAHTISADVALQSHSQSRQYHEFENC